MVNKLTHLDLFSGIGGFALAARWAGFETVQFVEYEPYAQKVLAKNFPGVPITGDIFDFDATKFLGIGLVTGGFPCQPFSQAGKRLGAEDDRAIWPQMLRVIQEARPTWVLGENVSGIISMELDNVLSDLEGEGYTTQTLVIPAAGVDAKHRRERVWICAYSSSTGRSRGEGCMETDGCDLREEVQTRFRTTENVPDSSGNRREQMPYGFPGKGTGSREQIHEQKRDSNCSQETLIPDSSSLRCNSGGSKQSLQGTRTHGQAQPGKDAPDSNSLRFNDSLERQEEVRFSECGNQQAERRGDVAHSNGSDDSHQEGGGETGFKRGESSGENGRSGVYWFPEPDVGRVANGVPSRVDRLKGLGNAICPQVAYEIIKHMKKLT